jgi:PAS domain S-box-containing protein
MSTLGLLNAVFLVIPTMISAYLGIYAWRRRSVPGTLSFMFAMVVIGAWCATSLLVVVSPDTRSAVFWVKVMLAVVPYLAPLILIAVMQTSVRKYPARPRLIVLLLIVPTITAFLTMTSDKQNIYLYNIGLVQSGAQNIGWTNQYGPWSVVHLSYSYALITFAIVLLVQQFIRMQYNTYQRRIFLLLVGLALPFITNVVNTLLSNVHYFITPIMFNVAAPIFFWAIFRYRLFEVLPVARDRAFEYMDDAIIIIDAENQIVDLNPNAALLAGQTAEALLQKPLFKGFVPFEAALSPLIESPVNHKPITVQQQDEQRYFDVTISPITHDQLQVGKLIIMHDMTDRHTAELRAHQLDIERERVSTLSQFIEAASHEFRTPLSIIKSSTFIISRTDDPTKRAEKIIQIDDQANRISQLVEALLNVVRVNTNVDLNLAPLDINALVEPVKNDLSAEATAKNIRFDLDLASHLPAIKADATYLPKAIHAVAHNAIQYTPAGGTITLTTCQQDSQVVIIVKDTGIGIDPEELPHIFDVFYRVDKSRSTAGFGTGLTIASRIIALHDGEIRAESQPGAGTQITITLPRTG